MSGTDSTSPNLGEQIGADIAAAETVIGPFIRSLSPGIGSGVDLALKLLAKAEPAAYNAIVLELQGTPLTDQQKTERDAAIQRLQRPDDYFKDE